MTLRDSIIMRAASFGAQFRSGGFIEDNIFLDNNVAMNFLEASYQDDGTELATTRSLPTTYHLRSAQDVARDQQGALTWGIDNGANLSSMVDNIVAHLADPNNPRRTATKTDTATLR